MAGRAVRRLLDLLVAEAAGSDGSEDDDNDSTNEATLAEMAHTSAGDGNGDQSEGEGEGEGEGGAEWSDDMHERGSRSMLVDDEDDDDDDEDDDQPIARRTRSSTRNTNNDLAGENSCVPAQLQRNNRWIMENDIVCEVSASTQTRSAFAISPPERPPPEHNLLNRLRTREFLGALAHGSKTAVTCDFVPNRCVRRLGPFHHSNFCGSFTKDGNIFMSACQDARIRFFDFQNSFSLMKEVEARHIGWSIIDTDFSPDQQFLIYSSWSNYVQLVNVFKAEGSDVHIALDFRPISRNSTCFFSIKFSSDSKEILAGSSDYCLYVYDVEKQARVLAIQGHDSDVNTVAWADDANNVFFSGSDDFTCKVWDRRSLGDQRPVGVLEGHLNGITYIHSRNDGRYFISNSKDQTIKLWDLRRMGSSTPSRRPRRDIDRFDYRFGPFRFRNTEEQQPLVNDVSIQTYRGHEVYDTLIRAKFSPLELTGQKYIYSGSYNGVIYIWDVLTGEVIQRLEGVHERHVRDISWHPTLPVLCSASWDGYVGVWEYRDRHSPGIALSTNSRRQHFTRRIHF